MTKSMIKTKLLFLALFSFFNFQTHALFIIVNKKNNITTMSTKSIKKIYLGKMTRWGNNEPTVIADYVSSHKLREKFSAQYLGKTAFKVYKIWIRHSLSGRTSPPHYFRDERDIVDYVSSNVGAIGYVKNKHKNSSEIKYIIID